MRVAAGLIVGSLLMLTGTAEAQQAPAMRWMPAHSSNYSYRSSRTIDRIVIHTVEGSEAGCISWFKNSRSNVSAHYVVSHAGRITLGLSFAVSRLVLCHSLFLGCGDFRIL